ncbi:uncharacterized protein LOC118437457 [Folsomia candida]|uniref:uncharacterized protein LOC118437457 n=1 Tax=Folsomia candida TaxID=158441 RepID=UPI0016051851|nr:uncharacterized protein LOC118437457 [Folsomia candida]
MENFHRHASLLLPEIIHKIMEFLPIPDLETISLVNSTWEEEALRHLLIRNPIDVHLCKVNDSTDLVPLRKLSPNHLNVIVCPSMVNLLSKIDLFTAIRFPTVKKLCLNISLDNAFRHVAFRMVKTYESFKNLTSLEFQFDLRNPTQLFYSDQNWADLLPDGGPIPEKLTNLSVNVSQLYLGPKTGRWENLVSLTTRFLTVFRNVQHFRMMDPPTSLMQERGLTLPHLKSICVLRTFTGIFNLKAPLPTFLGNVTRFEFNNEAGTSGDHMFHLLAPQLEHVCISGVKTISPFIGTRFCITIPVLPRLKVFEILRQQGFQRDLEPYWFRSNLYLKFETGRDEVKLVYGEQFPVLERLRVRLVPERGIQHSSNLHFKATMLFLYDTFLAEGVAPCGTLKNLDISIPSGDSDVGGRKKKRCLDWWRWNEGIAGFCGRISTIFPNVDHHVVERGKVAG